MDWFKKQKLSNWIIGALIVINTVTLVTLWVMRFEGPPEPAPPEDGPGRGLMVMHFLSRELDLSDSQLEALQGLRQKHFKDFPEMANQSMALRRSLMDEMFSESPDTVKVKEIIDGIGARFIDREIRNARHFQHLWTICTPEQRVKFKALIHEILPNPMVRGRRGRQHKGGPPFERGRRTGRRPGFSGKGQSGGREPKSY